MEGGGAKERIEMHNLHFVGYPTHFYWEAFVRFLFFCCPLVAGVMIGSSTRVCVFFSGLFVC